MKLREYLSKYNNGKKLKDIKITNITDIYQDLDKNGIFVSINGKSSCEINNIMHALSKSPSMIITSNQSKQFNNNKIPFINVENPKMELARLLNTENKEFEHQPMFIGITGTNGKTTTTYLLYQYLKRENYDVLLIGTNWIYSYFKMEEVIEETNNTTPTLSLLYKYLRTYKNEYDYVIMEISSQGIEEGRIEGLEFDVIGLTNLSAEHLDYHHTITEYRIAKSKLFSHLRKPWWDGRIILNHDDDNYSYFMNQSMGTLYTYGLKDGMIKAKIIKQSSKGTSFIIFDHNQKYEINTNLIGEFNVYNILMVWCIVKALSLNTKSLLNFLSKKLEIPGRMQVVEKNGRHFIIDFAHTSKAVDSVLDTVYKLKENNQIFTVIGCGGMRDKQKRPVIGEIVTRKSDFAIFTEDNSRDENTTDIINDITENLDCHNYIIILDRENAIKEAYKLSRENDIILILGKGVENYQIRKNNELVQYSDFKSVEKIGQDYEYLV